MEQSTVTITVSTCVLPAVKCVCHTTVIDLFIMLPRNQRSIKASHPKVDANHVEHVWNPFVVVINIGGKA